MSLFRRLARQLDTTDDGGFARPRRRIFAGVVVLLAPIWAIVLLSTFQQFDAARASAQASTSFATVAEVARALASLGRIDDLAASVEGHLTWGMSAQGLKDVLERHKINNPELFRLTDVVDFQGMVVVTTAPGHPSAATRNYDNDYGSPTDVAIGLPRLVGNGFLVPMARTLHGLGGKPVGTLVAEVDPSYFAGFYGDLGLPPGAAVMLFRKDGPLIARNLPTGGVLGRSYPDLPVWRAIDDAPEGNYHANDIDDVSRLVTYRVNGRMPIIVTIGLPDATVYGQAIARTIASIGLTAVLSLGIVAFAIATSRALERRAAIARALALSAAGVRSAGSGIAILSVTGDAVRVVQGNPTFLRIFDTDADSLRDREWTSVAGPAARGWLPARHEDGERHLEAEIQRADGVRLWAEIRAAHVRDGDVGGDHVVVVVTDITARKDAETQLIRARDEAEAANRAKSEFLANMSHELRTPLNAVIGFADIMAGELMGPIGTPVYRGYARDILMSGSHLLSIISDILDFAKIEATTLKLHEEEIDVGALLETCLRFIRVRAAEFRVAIEIDYPIGMPFLRADELRIKQIVINLLGNAIKFSPAGSTIRLEGRLTEAGGIEISVTDDGPGMNADEIVIAMQPFKQIEDTATKRREGTGLGLPLAKRLAELHGGTLTIDSVPGRGTCVRLALPPARVQVADGLRAAS